MLFTMRARGAFTGTCVRVRDRLATGGGGHVCSFYNRVSRAREFFCDLNLEAFSRVRLRPRPYDFLQKNKIKNATLPVGTCCGR